MKKSKHKMNVKESKILQIYMNKKLNQYNRLKVKKS